MRTSFLRPASVAAAGAALLVAGCTSSGPGAPSPVGVDTCQCDLVRRVARTDDGHGVVVQHAAPRGGGIQGRPRPAARDVPVADREVRAGQGRRGVRQGGGGGEPARRLRLGGPDNVAKFCYNGTVAPLDPYLAAAKVDVAKTFPAATLVYTQYARQAVRAPAARRRVRAVLQQEDVRRRRDHHAAQDVVRADRGRQEADRQEQRRLYQDLRVRPAL